jgi:endonuclease-3 related protein
MATQLSDGERIRRIFHRLHAALGPQHWWPAESPFEVVVGAFLTQNTAWANVELAMANLRRARVLSVAGIRRTTLPELEALVRPAGYFRQKAERLKLFVEHLDAHYHGRLEGLFAQPTPALRLELLALKGIGPETADSILLYAARHEVFVVDTYTRRIFERHGLFERRNLTHSAAAYDDIRLAVEAALAPTPDIPGSSIVEASTPIEPIGRVVIPVHQPSAASQLPRSPLARDFSEFHALLVQTAKHFCLKAEAHCQGCPLEPLLPDTLPPQNPANGIQKNKLRHNRS